MKHLSPEAQQLAKDFLQARDAETRWKKRKDAIRAALDDMLGPDLDDGEMLTDENEETVHLVVKVITGYKLDQKKLRSDYPEVYAKCQTETAQVRLESPK